MPKKQLNSRLETLFSSFNQREAAPAPDNTQSPPGWTWECNASGQYVACSSEITQVLGYSPEEILGQPLQSFGLASQSILTLCDTLTSGSFPAQEELYFQSRSGLLIPIRMHIFIRTDQNGDETGWRGFTQVIPSISAPPETAWPATRERKETWNEMAGEDRSQAARVVDFSHPAAPSISAGYAVVNGNLEPSTAPWTLLGSQAMLQGVPQPVSIVDADGSLAISFSTGSTSRGVIEILNTDQRGWTEEERSLAQEVASQLALALENAQLYAAVEQELSERARAEQETIKRNQDLAILNQIGQQLNRLATPSEILEMVFAGIGQVMDNRNLFIALYDPDNQHISFPIYSVDGQNQIVAGLPFGNGLIEYVLQTRKTFLLTQNVHKVLAERGIQSFGRTTASLLAVPLMTAEKIIGVIVAQDFEKEDAFTSIHAELLSTIASQATIALENANLFQQMQGALITIEVRERYQKNVARAVATLTESGTQSLSDVLRMLGEAAQTSRVYYVTTAANPENEAGLAWHIVSEWCDSGIPSIAAAPLTYKNLPISTLPFLANELKDQGRMSGTDFDYACSGARFPPGTKHPLLPGDFRPRQKSDTWIYRL